MSAIGGERVIRPGKPWYDIDWVLLFHYQDLLYLLVRRELVTRYRQTILGPVWYILQPLITTGVFTWVFSRELGTPTDGVPPFLFYQCGMLGWSYFSATWQSTGNVYMEQSTVLTKVYFPRIIVPLARMIASLASFGFQFLSFLAVYAGYRLVPGLFGVASVHVDWAAVPLLPLVVVQAGMFGLGVGLFTSAMSAKYRDLQIMLPFMIQISLFVTPVIYPLSRLGPRTRWLAALNPVTAVVESFRRVCFGRGSLSTGFLALSVAVTAGVLILGFAMFQQKGRTFADTI